MWCAHVRHNHRCGVEAGFQQWWPCHPWKSRTWRYDGEPSYRAEHVDGQTKPTGRAVIAFEMKEPAVAQDALRPGRTARVDPQALRNMTRRGAGHQPAVLGYRVEGDLLQGHPRQGAQLLTQCAAGR
jgi:hypothetical protein